MAPQVPHTSLCLQGPKPERAQLVVSAGAETCGPRLVSSASAACMLELCLGSFPCSLIHTHPPLPKARGSQYQMLAPSRVLWSPHGNQCLFRKVSLPVHLKTETHYLLENLKERRSRHVVRHENTSVLASNNGLEECGSPCSQSGPSLIPLA